MKKYIRNKNGDQMKDQLYTYERLAVSGAPTWR